MMKSENISPLLLKRVDELIRHCHPYLQETDEIYFLREYTVRERSEYSPTNQLIFNYKKSLERKEYPDWSYKEDAINHVANLFRVSIFNTIDLCERVKQATLVPIPPSEAKNSLKYDDRNYRMLKMFAPEGDIRELYLQKQSRDALHHLKNISRFHSDLLKNYILNEEVLNPAPTEIWLFDDTLIKGTHFRAAKQLLKEKFPNIPIIGFFIARSIWK